MVEVNKDLQMKFDGLADGYENDREQITRNLEICKPLYEADFCHDVCGTPHACFDRKYIESLARVLDGDAQTLLKAYLKDWQSTHANSFHIYMSPETVDFIIECLEYYRDTGDWKDCAKPNQKEVSSDGRREKDTIQEDVNICNTNERREGDND